MMDAVQHCACAERIHVNVSGGAKLAIGRYHGPLATPPDDCLNPSHDYLQLRMARISSVILGGWLTAIKGGRMRYAPTT